LYTFALPCCCGVIRGYVSLPGCIRSTCKTSVHLKYLYEYMLYIVTLPFLLL
jgi:hypothetical protein